MADAGFDIDGRTYEIPPLGTFTMDEAQILYDYSGLVVEDFLLNDLLDDEAASQEFLEKLRNPAVQRAILHVAYMRGNPDASAREVKAIVGAVNYLAAASDMLEASRERGTDAPLDITKAPNEPSQTSSDGSSASSGLDSTESSAPPAPTLDHIGIGASGTSSTAPETRSAA